MKTPERSRTSRVSKIVQTIAQKSLFCYGWRDVHKFMFPPPHSKSFGKEQASNVSVATVANQTGD